MCWSGKQQERPNTWTSLLTGRTSFFGKKKKKSTESSTDGTSGSNAPSKTQKRELFHSRGDLEGENTERQTCSGVRGHISGKIMKQKSISPLDGTSMNPRVTPPTRSSKKPRSLKHNSHPGGETFYRVTPRRCGIRKGIHRQH